MEVTPLRQPRRPLAAAPKPEAEPEAPSDGRAPARPTNDAAAQLKLAFYSPKPTPVQAQLQALKSAPPNSYVLDGKVATGLDVEAIKGAKLFSMKVDGPGSDDALVAAGVALAAGVPSLYVAPERKQLPWFLQEADQTYPGRVAVVVGQEPTADDLQKLQSQPLPAPTRKLDTFIGCLMSGLTKAEYAEGRDHLRAIDQAVGSGNNFCEGITVTSTDTFGTPKESLGADIDAVRSSQNCVFYQYDSKSRPSGMWVELGVALAEGQRINLLTPDPGCLPPSLRQAREDMTVTRYQDHAQMLQELPKLLGR